MRSLRTIMKCAAVLGVALALANSVAAAEDENKAPAAPKNDAAANSALLAPLVFAQLEGFPKEIEIPANRPGFCLDLGCGGGKLAAEIAQKTKYSVFALAKDEADCARARQALEQTNLYGTRAAAVAGVLQTLPFPKGYGNLIVTGEYQDALELKEVFRVLNPNGLAVIGGGRADAEKLKAALAAAGIKDFKLFGNYAVFRGKMPEDADDWMNFNPRPDNIRTSRETSIRPPFRTQWILGNPAYDDRAVQHAAIARGLIIYRPAVEKPQEDHYYAFDAFNGSLLWDRQVGGGKNNYRFTLLDGVYYATERGTIIALDAATGEKIKEYLIPDGKNVFWWWIAVENGTLYGLSPTPATPANGLFGMCSLFCAFDLKSGAVLWKYESKNPVVMASVALDGAGGLYFFDIEKEGPEKDAKATGTAYALEARTGQERWHAGLGHICTAYLDMSAAGCIDGKYFVWCCKDEKKGVQGTKSFDSRTGQLVKEYPGVHSWGEGLVAPVLFVDGKMYSNPVAGHSPYQCVDMATGAKVKTMVEHEGARDNPGTASAACLYAGGEGNCVYDLLSGKIWANNYFRVSDFAAPIPANGLLVYFPTVCHCPHAFAAPMAIAPGGLDWTPPDAEKDLALRLIPGPACATPLTEDGKEEWTHYRGNPGHTGETATAPKTPLAMGWERKLGGRLTPPSFGGGLAYVASREGSVWGLDEKTGEIRWKFLCGAGVRVTPAYGRGRVLFGSDDGWVYNLEAQTGQLAWRFRAAPEERYINVEGQLNSLWPSAAGVIVDGGVAYCAAGLMTYDGTYLYALDLQTGKAAWAKRIGDIEHEDGAPQGIMALAGETLVIPVRKGKGSRAYRKTNGEAIAWYPPQKDNRFWTFGLDAIADGDVWFYGGGKHSNDEDENRRHRARTLPFTLMDLKTGWTCAKYGSGDKPIAPENIAPVLGKTLIVGDGVAYDRARYCETLRQEPGKVNETKAWSVSLWPQGDPKKPQTTALALAGDVILAGGNSEVAAFEARPDGKELGRVAVPGRIFRNSLAVADRRVFVVTEEGGVYCLNGK